MNNSGFNKQQLDQLRSRFELQGLAIAQLPESIEQSLAEASQCIAESLLSEGKIILFGQTDAQPVAQTFVEELIDSSSMERPSLPGQLINTESDRQYIQRQLQTFGQTGDVLLIIQGSRQRNNTVNNDDLMMLCNEAAQMKIRPILLSSSELSTTNVVDAIQIKLDFGSRMNYLSCITICSHTLLALVDYHLFEQAF